ncbi:hypothetical protein MTO96_002249 [Rhipicephalus appendiculatus]
MWHLTVRSAKVTSARKRQGVSGCMQRADAGGQRRRQDCFASRLPVRVRPSNDAGTLCCKDGNMADAVGSAKHASGEPALLVQQSVLEQRYRFIV